MRSLWQTGYAQNRSPSSTLSSSLRIAEEGAQLLLEIFVTDFQRLAGESLRVPQVSGAWYERDKSQQDLVKAIAYAQSREWIDPLEEAFRLTKAGYQAANAH